MVGELMMVYYSKAYSNIVRTVRKMQDEGIEIDLSTLVLTKIQK